MVDVRDDRDVAEIGAGGHRPQGTATLSVISACRSAMQASAHARRAAAAFADPLAELDPDLVHRRLHVAVDDRAVLGDDGHRLDLGEERVGELLDLCLRRLAAREHAEVDADVAVIVQKGNRGEFLHRKQYTPTRKSSNARAAPR